MPRQLSKIRRSLQRWLRRSDSTVGRQKRRSRLIETLERRDLLTAAIWHNPVHPLDVSGDQPARVTPIDALLVINWLNDSSRERQLPRQVEQPTAGPYVDVTCDGWVTPLDALNIINHINQFGGSVVGGFSTEGGSFASAACSPQLREGSSFVTELERVLHVPSGRTALELTFEAPEFDTSAQQQIRDAFEVLIVAADGTPVSNPLSSSRGAALNWTEGQPPLAAGGTWTNIAAPGQVSSVTFDLAEFPIGTEIRVVTRLINNDSDNDSTVIIRGYQFIAADIPPASGSSVLPSHTTSSARMDSPLDIAQMNDLTGLFEIDYGHTSLSVDKRQLVSQARLTNMGHSAVIGPVIAVFDNFSDPGVFMVRPDGLLPDGRPYFVMNGRAAAGATGQIDAVLPSQAALAGPEIRFANEPSERFQYRLRIYGRINPGPVGFTSQPLTSIAAGQRYGYAAIAETALNVPLTYTLLSGPETMHIDMVSGQLHWQTQADDVGTHQVTIRASDPLAAYIDQTFELQVVEALPNRPPIFVSTGETVAVAAGAMEVITLPTGHRPAALAVGNFGTIDSSSINQLSLVAVNQASQTLSLIPGLGLDQSGQEAYGQPQSLSVGEPPIDTSLLRGVLDIDVGLPAIEHTSYDQNRVMGVTHGDFNGDGNLDVATSIVFQYRPQSGPDVFKRHLAITLGNGDGTFVPAQQLPIPGPMAFVSDNAGAVSLRSHDFDGDGQLDLLVSETKGKQLLFYKGLGDGSFASATFQTTGTDISGFKVALVDDDALLDLIALRSDGSGLGVMLGNGDGTFQMFAPFSTHTGYSVNYNFALGDLNGDGKVDVVSGNHQTNMLNVYLGNGDGTFERSADLISRGIFSTQPGSVSSPMALVIGDFTGDGRADIAYTTYNNSGFGTGFGGGIALYAGDGSGVQFSWSTAVRVAMTVAPMNVQGDAQPVDLNGDGHLDLVFTGPGEWGNFAPGVNAAINDGTGMFTSTFWIDSNLGTDPWPGNVSNNVGVWVGDFNNDGMPDLLTARSGRPNVGGQFASVSLMLADAPGTYRAAYDVRAQSVGWGTVTFVEYADFNNDGILDLWGPAYQNQSYTQLGKGDGTFQAPITATPYIGNESLGRGFVADLDLDGNLDVVWYGGGGVQGGPQGRYLAALGNGDGTFQISFAQTGNNTPSGYAPVIMKPADFDGDGHMDFAAITTLNTIEIMRGVPEVPGTFSRSFSTSYGGSTLSPSLGVGDFDSDGLQDVIAVRFKSGNVHDLLFYKGNGDGTLAEPSLLPFGPDTAEFRFPKQIAVGDLNHDGHLDFVINASYHRSAAVLGNGDGTFQPPLVYRTGTIWGDEARLELFDLDGDGHLDLVSIDDTHSTPRTLEVRMGLGDGTFGPAQYWGTSEGTGHIALGDLDNDGRIDIGVNGRSNQEAVATFLGNRPGLSDVVTVDLNDDGETDILAINYDNSHVKRMIGDGNGSFTRLPDLLVGPGPVDLLDGDFNNDGRPDFLTINRSGRSVSVMLADGMAGFSRTDIPLGGLPMGGALGPVTGGQHDDLLVIDAQLSTMSVLTQDGLGNFAPSALIPLGDRPNSITLGDVDGDGRADAIVSLAETNRLMIWRSLGNGNFADPTYVNLPTSPGRLAAADFNSDNLLDLAVVFADTGEVALLMGMGQSRFTQPQRIRVGNQPSGLVIADANGDGLWDILVTNKGDDTVSVILNRYDPNQLYRYHAQAIDPDDDPITYSILSGPGGMILDSHTGQIRWAPTSDQVGRQPVVLVAEDGRGGRTTQEFTIDVQASRSNVAPVITTVPMEQFSADQAFSYHIAATDPDGDRLRYRLVEGPDGALLDPVTGQLTWDPRGVAMQFNRVVQSDGGIQVPHSPAQSVASLTLEGWFRFASSGNQVLIDKALNWATASFFTLRYFSGNLQLLIGNGSSPGLETLSVARTLPLGQWIHLAATFDAETGVMSLLIDGNQIASRTTSKRIGTPGDNIPLRIGQEVYPFVGDLYAFRMWNQARTAEHIRADLHRQLDSHTPGLVLDLRFNEGASLSVIDHSAHNHRGLLRGSFVPRRILGMSPLQTAQFTLSVEDGQGGIERQSFAVSVVPKRTGTVSGRLFVDDNRDGQFQAGETALAHWTLFIDQNNNGYRDAGEASAVTNEIGLYQFHQLIAGDYTIAVETPAGFAPPPARRASVESQQITTSDIAAQPLALGQVRGRVIEGASAQGLAHHIIFADLNRNGLWDRAEPFTQSDAEGRYALGPLPEGAYRLRAQTHALWRVTAPTSTSHDVVLASDQWLDNLDFVLEPENSIAAAAPRIVTQPLTTAAVGQRYRYAVAATSGQGGAIHYSLAQAPNGMVIDQHSGQVVWTPTGQQLGSQSVIIRAATSTQQVDLQAFTIEVTPPNTLPVVTSTPISELSVGRRWQYAIRAQDAEQLELSFALQLGPAGATINSATGLLTWTPQAHQLGAHELVVLVSDGVGGETHHSLALTVTSDLPAAHPFMIAPPRGEAALLTRYLSRLTGIDAMGGLLSVELLAGPQGLNIDAEGMVQWSPTLEQLGMHDLRVQFTSPSGTTEEHLFNLTVRQRANNSAPQIQSQPGSLRVVANQLFAYDLVASDADHDALSYQLITGPLGMSLDPQHGTLRWLPSFDQLGQHNVSVRVTDPQGGSAVQNFTLSTRRLSGPPVIQSTPPTQAAVGSGYLYTVTALDAEHDPLIFSLIEAPTGMVIDERTGEVVWTPTLADLGIQTVFIAVADASGNRSTQGFAIAVANGLPNRPPVLSGHPELLATVGREYRTLINANDPEGSALTYSLRRGPAGMSVDAQSGQVTWTPTSDQVGRVTVALVARDAEGGVAVQAFEIDVLGVNTAPQIISTPPVLAWAGGWFQYDLIARDAERDPLRYRFTADVPAGMTIDPLGKIRWQTQATDVGTYSLTVQVSDPRGGETTQQINLEVRADNAAPKVTVLPRGGGWPWDGPIVVLVSAVDNVDVVDVELRVNDQLVPLDAARTARLRFEDWGPGVFSLVATARDAAGNVGRGVGSVFYRDPEVDYESSEGLPVATITSPSDSGSVYGLVEIVGTAIGGTAAATGFKEYRLSYARLDQLQFTEFVRSTSAVTEGLLGVWDTTRLENDAYILRLEVISQSGNTSVHESNIGVSGNLKLGNFRLNFEDLALPIAGIPITIARTYDTLRADRDGDFGYGWRLEYRETDLRIGLPKSGLEELGIYTPFRAGTKIYLSLPGGQRVGWTFTPEFRVLPGWGKGNDLVMASPRYTPDRGNTATLSAGSGWLTVNPLGELYAAAGMPWNPANPDFGGGFTVTTSDGTRYFIDGTTGLMQTATDRLGNSLTFSEEGISSSLGQVGIAITRDRLGRISSITDPAGHSIVYGYSANGDLVRVTDREGQQTTLSYRTDRPHYLDKVVDPLGRTGLRSEYADDGRLQGTIDARGLRRSFSFDVNERIESSTDALGNTLVHIYDPLGNLTRSIDSEGGQRSYAYDDFGNRVEEIDENGNRTRQAFDSFGNLIWRQDARGYQTRFVYNSSNNLTSLTDELGHTTRYEYDSLGRMTAHIDTAGYRTQYQVNSQGMITSVITSTGDQRRYEYSSSGFLTRSMDELGRVQEFSYDAVGNLLSASIGTGDAAQTTHYRYDKQGRQTRVTDALGATTSTTYDAAGNISSLTDALGQVVHYYYDAMNQLIRVEYPANGVNQTERPARHWVRNPLGFVVQMIDEIGAKTDYEVDSLGRIIRQQQPARAGGERSTVERTYYPDGKLRSETEPTGGTTHYIYDAMGNLVTSIDPMGFERRYSYNAANHMVEQVDPLGQKITYTYDSRGLLVSKAFDASTVYRFQYDHRGLKIAQTDPLNRTTYYHYDAVGDLVRVEDALHGLQSYTYDQRGQMVEVVDPNGARSTARYDAVGRLVSVTLPMGQSRLYEYDLSGNLIAQVDFEGQRTQFQYDSRGRMIRQTNSSGQYFQLTYNDRGERIEEQSELGSAINTFSPDGLILTRTDAFGNSVHYQYDLAGRKIEVRSPAHTINHQYDLLGRLTSVSTDAGSDAITRTSYTHDALGRVLSVENSNGIVASHTLDRFGRITSTQWTSTQGTSPPQTLDQVWYQYDAVGNRTRVLELDGTETLYRYDGLNRLVSERLTSQGVLVHELVYQFNAASQRTQIDGLLGGRVELAYDANGRLLTKQQAGVTTEQRSYDANGNLIEKRTGSDVTSYTWDSLGQLIAIDQGQGTTGVQFKYDVDGLRIETVDAQGVKRFVWDTTEVNGVLLGEQNAGGDFTALYVYGEGLIGLERDGNWHTYHFDAAGNPRMITNSAAEITTGLRFDALGNTVAASNSGGVNHAGVMFAGEQLDAGTGLYYLRSRFMDPSIGAFISADSTPANKHLPISSNTYLYALGNSQTYQDPSGQATLASVLVSNMIIGTVVGTLNLVYTRDIKQAAMAAATAAGTGIALTGLLYGMPLALGAATQFAFGLLPKAKQVATAGGVLVEITGSLTTTQMSAILTAYEGSGTLALVAARMGGPVAETLLELRTMVRAADPKLWAAVKELARSAGNSLKLQPHEVEILRRFLDILG